MTGLPFPLIDGIESAVIAFILSGMWWTGIHRLVTLPRPTLVVSTIATTAVIGAILLYLDHGAVAREPLG